MYLHHNDFIVWRDNGKMVVAKFRIVGEIVRECERIIRIPEPVFWDTNKNADPTRRIFVSVQFQFHGIKLEELTTCKVNICTSNGSRVEYYQEFQIDNEDIIEYSTYYPMVVTVENYLMNKSTKFEVNWERRLHRVQGEYIFYLRVGKYPETLIVN